MDKNIKILLKIKRFVRKIFFSDFISDSLIPIWDYNKKINLTGEQHEEWSKLDTLDGLYAKYDKPKSYNEVKRFLKKNNFKLINSNKNENCFHSSLI